MGTLILATIGRGQFAMARLACQKRSDMQTTLGNLPEGWSTCAHLPLTHIYRPLLSGASSEAGERDNPALWFGLLTNNYAAPLRETVQEIHHMLKNAVYC